MKEIAEKMIEVAIRNLKNDGHITPVALMFKQGSMTYSVVLDMSSIEAKVASANFVKSHVTKTGCDAVIFIFEAWFKNIAANDQDSIDNAREDGISNDPEKMEAIIVIYSSPKETKIYQVPFRKENEEIIIEPTITDSEIAESLFTDRLWPTLN